MSRTDGWESDGKYLHCDAFKHETYGYLTVDFESRTAASGLVMPRRHQSLVDPDAYKGRGWRERLLEDAFQAAMKPWSDDPAG